MTLSEVIRRAIPLAKAMSDYWEAELPRRFKQYPFVQEGEDRGPMPPEQVQLKSLLDSLPDEDVYRLQLVIECGRRGFGPAQFAERLADIKGHKNAKLLAWQMGEHLALWLQLEEGLEQMQKYGVDVNALFPVAKSA